MYDPTGLRFQFTSDEHAFVGVDGLGMFLDGAVDYFAAQLLIYTNYYTLQSVSLQRHITRVIIIIPML